MALTLRHKCFKLEAASDFIMIVLHYMNMESVPWEMQHLIKKVKEDVKKLEELIVRHREANMLADSLASISTVEGMVEVEGNALSLEL